jgi:hypothetical protein
MRYRISSAAVLAMALAASVGANPSTDPSTSSGLPGEIKGDYVEVRTAEVFTGGCIMGSEGEVSGKEAILAWRIKQGSLEGVALDGLSVVAVVAGDVNLGTHELGGVAPSSVKAIVMTDERANAAQQQALVAIARSMAPRVVNDVIETRSTRINFKTDADSVTVSAGPASLNVALNVEHSPVCGAVKWFSPLSQTESPQIGFTRSQEWTGVGLGSQWRQLDRKSSFFGSFTFRR